MPDLMGVDKAVMLLRSAVQEKGTDYRGPEQLVAYVFRRHPEALFTDEAFDVFYVAERAQDAGRTWGEALAAARERANA